MQKMILLLAAFAVAGTAQAQQRGTSEEERSCHEQAQELSKKPGFQADFATHYNKVRRTCYARFDMHSVQVVDKIEKEVQVSVVYNITRNLTVALWTKVLRPTSSEPPACWLLTDSGEKKCSDLDGFNALIKREYGILP
jgi:hypothetical protein